MTNEEWKTVKGFERYLVSNHGRVKSICNKVEIVMRQQLHYRGYKVLWLYNGSRKKVFVHRLVAEVFLENPDEKEVVNHIDSDKANNHITNLEWMTFSENTQYYYANKPVETLDGAPF